VSEFFDIKTIFERAGGYAPDAYRFIRDGLSHTVAMVHGQAESAADNHAPDDESLHVSGQQFCLGLRDYALQRYGLLARTVLRRWNIHTTEDFGRIVFALIDANLMRKTDQDTLDDFIGVYDFDEEFIEPVSTTSAPTSP
jgi:uncharacterized repeat protein (TIGR04138 family)